MFDVDTIWNVWQHGRISQAHAEAQRAAAGVVDHHEKIRDLEFTVHRLALASQAMWEILRDRLAVTDADLIEKITEIDLRDGAKDGRIKPAIMTCPQCHRTLSTKNSRCIYCGVDVPKPHVFQ